MFEMNRPGMIRGEPGYAEKPDLKYIREQVKDAIASLEECEQLMPGAQLRLR
jgi:hypothetical protein